MIDLAKIGRQPTRGRIIREVLFNAPQLLLMLYGLICIVTQTGRMLLPYYARKIVGFHFVPVTGTLAFTVGCLYFALGLFLYLSDGRPPPENSSLLWRCGRSLVRWTAATVAFVCFLKACEGINGSNSLLQLYSSDVLMKILAVIAGVVALYFFLHAMFLRQQIKYELDDSNCRPLQIRWVPGAYWLPWTAWHGSSGFRVIYEDSSGLIHGAYCYVYCLGFGNDTIFGSCYVKWLADTTL